MNTITEINLIWRKANLNPMGTRHEMWIAFGNTSNGEPGEYQILHARGTGERTAGLYQPDKIHICYRGLDLREAKQECLAHARATSFQPLLEPDDPDWSKGRNMESVEAMLLEAETFDTDDGLIGFKIDGAILPQGSIVPLDVVNRTGRHSTRKGVVIGWDGDSSYGVLAEPLPATRQRGFSGSVFTLTSPG